MPVTQTVRADALKVFRVGGGPRAPTSALPIGAVASAVDPLKVTHVPVATDLVQSVLAVSHAETPEQVLSSNVAGFILVRGLEGRGAGCTIDAGAPLVICLWWPAPLLRRSRTWTWRATP